jgi:2-phosphosulfolactate phosphatase
MSSEAMFFQEGFDCRFDWGPDGARNAALRGETIVVVDTLRFSTVVAIAVGRGALVFPCAPDTDAVAYARHVAATAVDHRQALSPHSYTETPAGSRIVLPSPNGAMCCLRGAAAPALFVGALVNARVTAAAVAAAAGPTGVTVIACGEQGGGNAGHGAIRHAVEDALGAGAIISYLPGSKSPEAETCEAAFLTARDRLSETLWECVSGQELRERGFGEDVRFAAQLDSLPATGVLRGDYLQAVGRVAEAV